MLDVANSKDASGEYIFSGFNASTKPFVKEGDGYQYKGDQGERFLQVSEDIQVQVRDSGATIFQKIREGDGRLKLSSSPENTGNVRIFMQSNVESVVDSYALEFVENGSDYQYVIKNAAGDTLQTGDYDGSAQVEFNNINLSIEGDPGSSDRFDIQRAGYKDIFTTLQDLADVLSAPADTSADKSIVSNYLGQSLDELDQVMDRFSSARSSLGSRLQQLDTRVGENIDEKIRHDRSISELKDLDYAEAVSRLNMQMTGLQAAQQSYVKIQGLSLFNYLR